MRTAGLSLIAGACLMAASAASADEVRLGDQELDAVTAGFGLDGFDLGFDPMSENLGTKTLLQAATIIVLNEIALAYSDENDGASILADPTLGPIAFAGIDFVSPITPIIPPFDLDLEIPAD